MAHDNEIPTDAEVCNVLQQLGNPTATDLTDALIKKNYERRDAQRAVQRCLDRGKIVAGPGLRLSLANHLQAA